MIFYNNSTILVFHTKLNKHTCKHLKGAAGRHTCHRVRKTVAFCVRRYDSEYSSTWTRCCRYIGCSWNVIIFFDILLQQSKTTVLVTRGQGILLQQSKTTGLVTRGSGHSSTTVKDHRTRDPRVRTFFYNIQRPPDSWPEGQNILLQYTKTTGLVTRGPEHSSTTVKDHRTRDPRARKFFYNSQRPPDSWSEGQVILRDDWH